MRKAAHLAIIEGNRMLMTVRADGTLGFIGGKQDPEDNGSLKVTLAREFGEEVGMVLPSRVKDNMIHIMAAPSTRELKCTLFACVRNSGSIPYIMNIFKPNNELCGVVALDISPENRKNIMKMKLANGVKHQLEVLFKHVI